MAGSLLITVMPSASPLVAIAYVSVPSAVLGIWAALSLKRLAGQEDAPVPPRRPLQALPPRLAFIAICALAASMTEGAMSDWAAVYLSERLSEGSAHAGVAVSIFAGFLAVGRFMGDLGKVMLGAVILARFALTLASVGLLLLIVPLPLWTSYVAFALIGLGVSVGFPLAVSAAASLDDAYEGPNIAIVSMVTMLGFLIGPPLIGGLAEAFTLRVGLSALLPVLLVGIWLARWLRPA